MKILHVTETAKGGVGSFLDELLPLQRERLGSGRVRAIVPTEHRNQLAAVADEDLLLFPGERRSLKALRSLHRLLNQALSAFQPDILHLHSTFAGLVGRSVLNGAAPDTIVYNPHGWAFEIWPSGPKRWAAVASERLFARRCSRIVAVSEAERDQALAVGLPAKMIAVVRNGIAMTVPQVSAARWEDERIKVLFVGRLDRQKGFDTLADIARRQGKTVAVRVIGASVTNGQESAAELDNVEHFGWLRRSEIIRHLHACDVVAMPSRWEGLPISALEAMRSAKPVIAFAVGGLAEVIEDRVTGRLIPPGDARAFEQALITTPPAVLREWGCAGRQRFERLFTSTRMARELFDIYATGNKDV